MYVHVCIVCVCVYIYTMYVCIYIHKCVCIICMYVLCVFVCMCVIRGRDNPDNSTAPAQVNFSKCAEAPDEITESRGRYVKGNEFG